MRRALLQAAENACEPGMSPTTPCRRGNAVHRRRHEWMREANSLAVDRSDPRRGRLHECGVGVLFSPYAAVSTSTVGRGRAAAASSTSRVDGASFAMRRPIASDAEGGTGIGALGSSGRPRSTISAATSLPNSGFPSHAAWSCWMTGRGSRAPAHWRTTAPKAAASSGPTSTLTTRSADAGIWISGPVSERIPTTSPTCASSRRRRAKPSVRSDGGSHHCRSSSATSSRSSAESDRSAATTARLSPSGSTACDSSGSIRRKATSSARRCGTDRSSSDVSTRLEQVGEDAERKFCLRLGWTGGERSEAGRSGPGQPSPPAAPTCRSRRHPGTRAPGTPRAPTGGTGRSSRAQGRVRRATARHRIVGPVRRENPVESPDVSAAPRP